MRPSSAPGGKSARKEFCLGELLSPEGLLPQWVASQRKPEWVFEALSEKSISRYHLQLNHANTIRLLNPTVHPVYGRRGMCASSQPLASAIGVSILNAGGSAADAGVAMAAALNVTEPTSTGLGGDVFVLYFQASDQSVYALNGSGRAPAGLTLDAYKKKGLANHSRLPTPIPSPCQAPAPAGLTC